MVSVTQLSEPDATGHIPFFSGSSWYLLFLCTIRDSLGCTYSDSLDSLLGAEDTRWVRVVQPWRCSGASAGLLVLMQC